MYETDVGEGSRVGPFTSPQPTLSPYTGLASNCITVFTEFTVKEIQRIHIVSCEMYIKGHQNRKLRKYLCMIKCEVIILSFNIMEISLRKAHILSSNFM